MSDTDTHTIAAIDTSIEHVVAKGNILRVTLADGTTDWVAATEKNRLLYEHRVADHLAGGRRYELSEDPYRAVETDDFAAFRVLTDDAQPLYAPPEHGAAILRAVREHRDAGTTDAFDRVVDLLTTEYARPHVVNGFVATVLADEPVRVVPEGWILHDLFLLTWNCDVFPYSGDDDTPTRWDRDADTSPSLYALSELAARIGDGDGDGDRPTVTVEGTTYELTTRDLAFLAAARWLLQYEDAEEFYPEYWANFRRAIDRQTA